MIETQSLNIEPGLKKPGDFYSALMELHRNLDEQQSKLANAKLILLLANHIGDEGALREALMIAGEGLR